MTTPQYAEEYRWLAARLDALPNGFPSTPDGLELAVLAYLFTPEEAELAAQLRLTPETPATIAARIGRDADKLSYMLTDLANRGLIDVVGTDEGPGYTLMPFVVGFYENQGPVLDAELARLVEAYFKRVFTATTMDVEPQFHRVIPINETIPVSIDIQPFESAMAIINRAQAWGVAECICRKQKELIGEACGHPLEVCMVFSSEPGAFDQAEVVRPLTREESLAMLRAAADAGLVHTVGNRQDHTSYICNCCTCGCGILRGIAELGMANVVARAAFESVVDAALCTGCQTCAEWCQFGALALDDTGIMAVDRRRCVGCGQCALHCEQGALALVRRPEDEIKPIPATLGDWQAQRAAARGRDLADVL
ncbi:MAG: 4Fe-4S binding protein [Anaerolineae bacterium]|nr:4Fe-4S binding protein [Anaerolineae bacterium]